MYNSQNIPAALSRIENMQVRENFKREGFYRASVVSNIDPMGLGRIKVRIPSLHGVSEDQTGYVSDTSLPYAFPGSIAGAGYREGQYIIPSIGHTVWVSFETGTENLIYFGSLYSKAPENDKFIYKSRETNNGEPIQVLLDDIPADYHPDKHVIYKSYFGDIIYIDDRKKEGTIVIEDRKGNKISFGNTVTISTKEPLNANFPYMKILYSSIDYKGGAGFRVPRDRVFEDSTLETQATDIVRDAIMVFMDGDEIGGTGLIYDYTSEEVLVGLISEAGTGHGTDVEPATREDINALFRD